MKWTLGGAFICAILLVGCAGTEPRNSRGDIVGIADAGAPPISADAVIQPYLQGTLKDPHSAQVVGVQGPAFITVSGGLLTGAEDYGWGICFKVNAKNSFGAYVGFRDMALLWRNGSVRKVFGDLGSNMFDQALAHATCEQIQRSAIHAPMHARAAPSPAPAAPAGEPTDYSLVPSQRNDVTKNNARADVSSGQEQTSVEQLARMQACTDSPRPVLLGKGAGFESYSVTCTNGDVLAIRCELGMCRVLR